LKHLLILAVVAAALILSACSEYQPGSRRVSSTQPSFKACVIGGVGYPITSPVGRITADLRALGIKALERGPDNWPEISSCDVIIAHSLGVDIALRAKSGKRLIVAIDAFTHRHCPQAATVVDIYNSDDSFPTTGLLACAQRIIAIDSGFGLWGHIKAPITASPTVAKIVREYLTSTSGGVVGR
jgi:hypothetical protein